MAGNERSPRASRKKSDSNATEVGADTIAEHFSDIDSIDPEDQETVMYGQRALFGAAEKAAAERLSAAQQKRKSSTSAAGNQSTTEWEYEESISDHSGSAAAVETIEVSSDLFESGDQPAAPAVDGKPRKKRKEPKRSEEKRDTGRQRDPEHQKSLRLVAEKRPLESGEAVQPVADKRGDPRGKHALHCACHMCARGVTWPRARRFRGSRRGRHGFRCDTCGNVFCPEHVLRVSAFFESLRDHGRFRCLLCELGNRAKELKALASRGTAS